jgi:hypothetical protein
MFPKKSIAYGTWPNRFIDWFRDLGFFQKPGVETQAAKDIETFVKQPPRGAGRRGGGQGRVNGGVTNAPASLGGATP